MANRCSLCGGTLRYNIQKQKLVCDYCDSEFDPENIEQMGGAKEEATPDSTPDPQTQTETVGDSNVGETMEATVFTCPNCGAQVFTTDLDAVEYCSYCGTFVTLESHLAKLQKPSYIAPFTITKEKCIELYKEQLKKAHFLPPDMKAEKTENSFRNIYIPFWVYEINFDKDKELSFSTSESWSTYNYEYTQKYTIKTKAAGHAAKFYDASATLDDRIGDAIGDFPPENLLEYNSSYMAGAYADVADVEKGVYQEEAVEKTFDEACDTIRDKFIQDYSTMPKRELKNKGIHNIFRFKDFTAKGNKNTMCTTQAKLAMLPVWFMTTKTNGRLCYSVVNGCTGSMFTELPADGKKYCLASLLVSIPIFLYLELLFVITPRTLLGWVCFFSFIILCSYGSICHKLKRKELRTDDKGYQQNHGKHKTYGTVEGMSFSMGAFLPILSIIISIFAILADFAEDFIYYALVFITLASVLLCILLMVKTYNRFCSRPIPRFFDKRKEV